MNRHIILTALGSALAVGAVLPLSSQAGGIELYEIATPDVGLASAGYAARAQDASTLFKNPAGMSLLPGSQFQAGAQLTYGNVAFSPDSSTTTSGGNGGNAIGALPAAGLFFSQQLSDRFAVGLGAFSYFGLAEQYRRQLGGALLCSEKRPARHESHAGRQFQSHGLAVAWRGP